jgi:hypothetical protein
MKQDGFCFPIPVINVNGPLFPVIGSTMLLVFIMGHDDPEICAVHSQLLWNFHRLVIRNIYVPSFYKAMFPDYGFDSFKARFNRL